MKPSLLSAQVLCNAAGGSSSCLSDLCQVPRFLTSNRDKVINRSQASQVREVKLLWLLYGKCDEAFTLFYVAHIPPILKNTLKTTFAKGIWQPVVLKDATG